MSKLDTFIEDESANMYVEGDVDLTEFMSEIEDGERELLDKMGGKEDNTKSTSPMKPIMDPELKQNDFITLIKAELNRKGIAGNSLRSINHFYQVGIKQIITKLYSIEQNKMKNLRDKTEEDRSIESTSFLIEFTNVNLTKPTITKYKSGSQQMLTPNMARLKNLTYSAPLYVDASITATAYYKDGTTKERTAEVKNFRIATIPVMVRSVLCNTYKCSYGELKELQEDPKEPGGYFIVQGTEWCIDNLENILINGFHVYKNMYGNEIARGMMISKPGDAFENSSQIILKYLTNGNIVIQLTTNKFSQIDIPFYVIFRVFGMTKDIDIINNIVYGVNNNDPITKRMLNVLENAFKVDDGKFTPIRNTTNPVEIMEFLSQKMYDYIKSNVYKKDDNALKYLNNNIMSLLDKNVLPHIGQNADTRIRKLRFIGHLIHKLLRVEMEVLRSTDRDSYKNKRAHASGVSLTKTFKANFNLSIAQELRKGFTKAFKNTPFSQVNIEDVFRASINPADLERALVTGIVSGNKTITIKRNEVTNRLSSQQLYHKNDLNVYSILNTINTANTSSSKQNARADEMRRVHPTYLGFICPSQSADTGEKVGMSKQLTATCSITDASNSYLLKDKLLNDNMIIPLDEVINPEDITAKKYIKVFVNGDWIGFTTNGFELARKYRMKRRSDEINPYTSIVCEPELREVYFWVDVGRLIRPLLIVYNNVVEYVESLKKGKPIVFQQWIKLTKQHIIDLQAEKITMEDLRKQKIIEYISPDEAENTYIAMSYEYLLSLNTDITHQFTHCDIPQATWGLLALTAPCANHTDSTRVCFQTNQRKQTCGWHVLNWPYRIDKNTFLQYYCDIPLAPTFTDSWTYPCGHNALVALAIHSGFNQEDSTILNKSAIDRGFFLGSHYNFEKTELEKGEQFGNPDFARTLDEKKNAIYEYCENGFIKEGTLAKKGYVLVIKSAKIPKPTDDYLYVDRSIVYKNDEPAIVEKVIRPRNQDDILIAKVKLRSYRPIRPGDKISSRSGNKSIVAQVINQIDMPYSEDGVVPDIIMNPHSIPTRMCVGQIVEGVITKLAIEKGCLIDATTFKDIDVTAIIDELESMGFKHAGYRRLYNGRFGNHLDTMIFMAHTGYQRLQKFVLDENYAVNSGPTCALTRQPLDGKNNSGGLRIGEMEKDVLCSGGSMRTLYEKFSVHSDGVSIPICRTCGKRAVVNERAGIYKCKYCEENADVAAVSSSWASNLGLHEIASMGVDMKFELEPYTYSKLED